MITVVTIKSVDKYGVTYTNGLEASRDNFPNVEVGQTWEVITSETHPEFPNFNFPLGVIVSTRLIEEKIK